MQGLVVVGLIVEEIQNVDIKWIYQSHRSVKYVKVTRSRYLPIQYSEMKHYARFGGCRSYS